MFNIPLSLHDNSLCSIRKNSDKAELIHKAEAVIWDEAPMQHHWAMEAVDRTCRDVRSSNLPFGGLTVIFGGDFHQILPVIPNGSRQDIIDAALSRSHLWTPIVHFGRVLSLTENMRLERSPEDTSFGAWLLQIGEGQLQGSSLDTAILPEGCKVQGSIQDLIRVIYSNVNLRQTPEYFSKRIILSTRNADVDEINQEILNMCPGEEHTLIGANSIVEDELDAAVAGGNRNDAYYTQEFLQGLRPNGFPLSKLNLKVGVPVMVLRNLNVAGGICNGTRMLITRICSRVLEGHVMGGKHDGEKIWVPRITLRTQKDDLPFIL
jgi:PIF1-like helicase